MVLGLLTVFGRSQLGPFSASASSPAPPACHGTR
jgi:hypothetical protein